jgi:hypothetical protein
LVVFGAIQLLLLLLLLLCHKRASAVDYANKQQELHCRMVMVTNECYWLVAEGLSGICESSSLLLCVRVVASIPQLDNKNDVECQQEHQQHSSSHPC